VESDGEELYWGILEEEVDKTVMVVGVEDRPPKPVLPSRMIMRHAVERLSRSWSS
jgi:hypothetical protein